MTFLLDTNVVSAWVSPQPDPGVAQWIAAADEDRLYVSVICFAEIRRGVAKLSDGKRKRRLVVWLEDELRLRFENRILGIDLRIADLWGSLTVAAERIGLPLSAMDAFLAATAKAHDLTLVTRNVKHFEKCEIAVLNPWIEGLES